MFIFLESLGIEELTYTKKWAHSIGLNAFFCYSFHKPKQKGVIIPSELTAVASANIQPILALAKVLKWEKCQSFGNPSLAEYIHKGDKTILLENVTPLMLKLENNLDIKNHIIIIQISLFFYLKITLKVKFYNVNL